MNFCGIICEYNPLHYGHIFHIQKTAVNLNPDAIICIMSGNFVQRGELAIADKYTRAMWAVRAGADLVIELPAIFSVSPAENFSFGAIKILSAIKSVKYLSFGSEFGNIEQIEDLSKKLDNKNLTKSLKSGVSYASAFSDDKDNDYKPNNILAVEYLRALKKLKSHIMPFTLKRQGEYNDLKSYKILRGNDYKDNDFNADGNNFASASYLRKMLYENNLNELALNTADYVMQNLNEIKDFEKVNNSLFLMLTGKILSTGIDGLESFAYISEGLHRRIYNSAKNSFCYKEFLDNIKTKRYPQSKINRILLNILLGISKEDVLSAKKSPPYARVLAVKSGREDIISDISKYIKVIARADDYKDFDNKTILTDILATDLYAKLKNISNLNDLSKGLLKY